MKTLEKINRIILIIMGVACGTGIILHAIGSFMRIDSTTENIMLNNLASISTFISTVFFGLFIIGFLTEISLTHFKKN